MKNQSNWRFNEMSKKEKLKIKLLNQIKEQKDWIQECGGTLQGYLKKYGDASKDKIFCGSGGRAIYKADTDALHKLEEELRKVKDNILICKLKGEVRKLEEELCKLKDSK